MSPAICFYHSADLDGKASAAVVRHHVGPNVVLYGINYGQLFPWDLVEGTDADVYMVDFSLQPLADMFRLAKTARRLVWIDHHESVLKDAAENHGGQLPTGPHVSTLVHVGIAACELTWRWFKTQWYEGQTDPLSDLVRVPAAIRLLSRYDIWNNSDIDVWNQQILPFQYGMRLYDTDPGASALWGRLLTVEDGLSAVLIEETIERGQLLLEYEREQHVYAMKAATEGVLELAGKRYRVLLLNRHPASSTVFDSRYNPAQHDLMVAYGHNGRTWVVHLYTTHEHVHCGEIARSLGGGGHAQAAGFSSSEPAINWLVK